MYSGSFLTGVLLTCILYFSISDSDSNHSVNTSSGIQQGSSSNSFSSGTQKDHALSQRKLMDGNDKNIGSHKFPNSTVHTNGFGASQEDIHSSRDASFSEDEVFTFDQNGDTFQLEDKNLGEEAGSEEGGQEGNNQEVDGVEGKDKKDSHSSNDKIIHLDHSHLIKSKQGSNIEDAVQKTETESLDDASYTDPEEEKPQLDKPADLTKQENQTSKVSSKVDANSDSNGEFNNNDQADAYLQEEDSSNANTVVDVKSLAKSEAGSNGQDNAQVRSPVEKKQLSGSQLSGSEMSKGGVVEEGSRQVGKVLNPEEKGNISNSQGTRPFTDTTVKESTNHEVQVFSPEERKKSSISIDQLLDRVIYGNKSHTTFGRMQKTSTTQRLGGMDQEEWRSRQTEVVKAFEHAWKGYKSYAFGQDELKPVSQIGENGLGGLGATILDSLDTAMLMGLDDVVNEASQWIDSKFSQVLHESGQVNLFETTIRVLGGLLSAYHLSQTQESKFKDSHGTNSVLNSDAKPRSPSGINSKMYLEKATELGKILMVAFTSSPTPIPLSDVVLRSKSAHRALFDGGASSTAECTTLQLEFLYLSELTSDPSFGEASMQVLKHIKELNPQDGLVPIFIDPETGQFMGQNIRLGSRGDSYYEYLLKVWIQQNGSPKYLREMYDEAMTGVRNRLVQRSEPHGLVFVGELPNGIGGHIHPKMDHLVCFLAGTLALGATGGLKEEEAIRLNKMSKRDKQNLELAKDLGHTCYQMYASTATGLAPEIAYFNTNPKASSEGHGTIASSQYAIDIDIHQLDRHNLLRPETVESLLYLYRITGDIKYRKWGWNIFKSFEQYTKVESGGYSSLNDVTVIPPPKRDKMETFFLGETLKYLFLLFGDDDVLPLDKYVFNTEAHPFPILKKPTLYTNHSLSGDQTWVA